MGSPGFLLQPWRDDYVTEDQRAPVTPSPPPSPMLTAPPQASGDSGGGFWGGLLGILKNVPITIGDTRKGHVQNLGSYNQLMAGRDLAQWGRDQGLEMQGLGDFPNPDVARFAVQQGLERREKAPIGMETINRLFPVQPGEDPSMAQSRAMLAQIPQNQWGTLASHVVSQYGLPGFGSGLPSSAGFAPDEPGTPSPPTPVAPVSPTLAQPQAPSTPSAPMPPTAPSTAPLASQGGPVYPSKPPPLETRVTLQQQQAHGPVVAAEAAYRQNPTMQNRAALFKARGEARQQILQERQRLAGEAHKQYGEDVRAYAEARKAMKPDWGTDDEMTKQLIMDFPALGQPGAWPTPEQRNISATNLPGRLAADKAREVAAIRTTTLGVEREHQLSLPISVTEKERGQHWYYTDRVKRLPGSTTGSEAEALGRQGKAVQVPTEDSAQLTAMASAADVLREGIALTNKVYDVLDGEFGKMTSADRADPAKWLSGHWDQLVQEHAEIVQAQRYWAGALQVLARGIGAAKGDLSQQELTKANALVPQMEYLAQGFGVKVGPGGVGIGTPSQLLPDTREVALRTMDNSMQLLNQRTARLLGTDTFQYPGLRPRTDAQYARERDEQARQRERTPNAPLPPDLALEKKIGETVKQGVQKAKAFLTPGAPASPAAATMEQVRSTALKQHGLAAPPNPHQDPQGFQAFMTTVREQVRRYQPHLSPAQQDQLTGLIAQRYGGQWQPHP